jgi:hypothetical protein
MYLRIHAKVSRFEPMPLFGRSLSVSISVIEGRRVNGKPKQFHLGSLAHISVPCTAAEADVAESFWQDVRERMKELGVPDDKQKDFVSEIEKLLGAIADAKRNPELRKELADKPNQVLSVLRKQAA